MIWSEIKRKAWQFKSLILVVAGVSGLVILGSFTSAYEPYELSTLDLWFRLRSSEDKESRIVVVNISESDIRALNEWPISDDNLAELLEVISEQQPRVIGLDIYRDLPTGNVLGQERLRQVFATNKNIIGVEKVIGDRVDGSPILKKLGQTAMADMVVDQDGRIRRGLISVRTADNQIILGLSAKLALIYLAEEGVYLEATDDQKKRVLGRTTLSSISKNEGAYINADVGGYQIIVNWLGNKDKFRSVSLVEVLERQISSDLFEDKLVLIGSTASSVNDLFYTPYDSYKSNLDQMHGVYVHGNLASQIVSSALDGRNNIRGIPEIWEWSWIFVWSSIGVGTSLILLDTHQLQKNNFLTLRSITLSIIFPVGILFGTNYSLFLMGLWLPTIAPLLSLVISAIAITSYYHQNQTKLAFTDSLTLIANRRFFDRYLKQKLYQSQNSDEDLSIILCDVDFFKKYNDTYGHQAGDQCLMKVAQAIRNSVRGTDLPARYGGEEFIVVLPGSDSQAAILVANRICSRIRKMQIPHENSQISSVVSISCGISSIKTAKTTSPEKLIAQADRALYMAKSQGRDRAVLADTKEPD